MDGPLRVVKRKAPQEQDTEDARELFTLASAAVAHMPGRLIEPSLAPWRVGQAITSNKRFEFACVAGPTSWRLNA